MKRNTLLKGLLVLLLLAVPLLLSGCVVGGGGVENTSTSDLTFPDINTVINPPTTAPTANSSGISPLNPPTGTPAVNWGAPTQTPTVWTISSAQPTSETSYRVTPPPTSAPTATPTGTLQLGSTGDAVKGVQQKLKSLGFYRGSVDGDFGEGTENAVKEFQKQYGLTVDGKVGTQTLVSLQLGYDDAPVTTPPPPAPAPETFTDTAIPSKMSVGSKGNCVIKLQQALKAEGVYSGAEDGYFGDSTKIAVMEYQLKYNQANPDKPQLPVSGVADTATLTALGLKPSAEPSTSKLQKGSTGEMVETLQQKLKDLGLYTGPVNGIFDSDTEAAVKAFQKNAGLKQDGIVGSATWQKLTGTYMGGGTLPESVTHMKKGSKGGDVFQLQSFLKDKGYLPATIDGKDTVDGKFGDNTAVAVMKYQKAKGLKVDGKVGAETYAQLKADGLLSYPTK